MGDQSVVTSEKNPLLTNTIIDGILKFLPFGEIKKCRVICSRWNSVAEPLIRKQGKIRFRSKFRPSHFLKHFDSTRLPKVPFTAFKFSSSDFPAGWPVQDLLDFFQKWSTTLKYLELTNVTLMEKGKRVEKLDLNPWIDLLSKNLIELKVTTSPFAGTLDTSFVVSMDKLASIQNISLSNAEIILNSTGSRINPRKISLHSITFLQNGNKIQKVALNDIIDVSECSEFSFGSSRNSALEFDMSKDAANTEKIEFDDVRVLNWKISKVNTERLKLEGCPLEEETPIQMKELYFKNSTIDVSLLPKTMEKLTLYRSGYFIIGNDNASIIHLPNLKSLKVVPDNITAHSAFRTFKRIFKTATYPKLVDVELQGCGGAHTKLVLDWLPRNLKKLKLFMTKNLVITGTIDVSILILDVCSSFPYAAELMQKIRPKILVFTRLSCDRQTMNRLMKFVFQNKQLEKIVVEINGMHKSKVFDYAISNCVDKRSDHYEFNNQSKIGTAITQYEFKLYSDID